MIRLNRALLYLYPASFRTEWGDEMCDVFAQQCAGAGPDDGVAARLWRANDRVEMRADVKGTRLSVGRANELVFQEPPMSATEAEAGCTELKDELRRVTPEPPVEQVLAACERHMPDGACRRCLGLP